jgi:hypothetical protein
MRRGKGMRRRWEGGRKRGGIEGEGGMIGGKKEDREMMISRGRG